MASLEDAIGAARKKALQRGVKLGRWTWEDLLETGDIPFLPRSRRRAPVTDEIAERVRKLRESKKSKPVRKRTR